VRDSTLANDCNEANAMHRFERVAHRVLSDNGGSS